MGIDVAGKQREVEAQLLELAYLFAAAETDEERGEGLDAALKRVCEIVAHAHTRTGGRGGPREAQFHGQDQDPKGTGHRA